MYQFFHVTTSFDPPYLIGRPLPGVDAFLLDEDMNAVASGEMGELCLSGIQLATGYINLPQHTAEKFLQMQTGNNVSATVYRTGDYARQRSDGCFEYLGRRDFQVKLRGRRVELPQIEVVLCECNLVRHCVVMVNAKKALVAAIGLLCGVPNNAEAAECYKQVLKYHCSRQLPEYMVPTRFLLLEHFPLTLSGKVQRPVLEDLANVASETNSSDDHELATFTEKLLGVSWSEVLGVAVTRRTANFFSLGGDSLAALRVIRAVAASLPKGNAATAMNEKTGVISGYLSPQELLARPVLKEYALFLERNAQHADSVGMCTSSSVAPVFDGSLTREETLGAEALTVASRLGLSEVIRFLLKENVSADGIWTRKRRISTPLHAAARAGHVDILRQLLDAGATLTAVNRWNALPAHDAAMHSARALYYLLHAGTPIAARSSNNQTLLHVAARTNNLQSLKVLLQPSQFCKEEEQQQNVENEKWAAAFHQLLDARDRWNRTALHWTVLNGHKEALELLLAEGASPNSIVLPKYAKKTHLRQETPLHTSYRLFGKDAVISQLLLQAGADPNALDQDGHLPSHYLPTTERF